MNGWVRVYRQMMDKPYYRKDSEKVHFWIHLLLMANHTQRNEYLGREVIICEPGQFTTGRKQLSEQTGISESKVERLLNFFEKTEQQIEQRKTTINRLITILNWKEYQGGEQRKKQRMNNVRTTFEHTPRIYDTIVSYKEVSPFYLDQVKVADAYVERFPEAAQDREQYKKFILWLYDWENVKAKDPLGNSMQRPKTSLLGIKKQLQFVDFAKQSKKAKSLGIDLYTKLDAMENSPSIKDRVDFNLTLNTWLKPFVK